MPWGSVERGMTVVHLTSDVGRLTTSDYGMFKSDNGIFYVLLWASNIAFATARVYRKILSYEVHVVENYGYLRHTLRKKKTKSFHRFCSLSDNILIKLTTLAIKNYLLRKRHCDNTKHFPSNFIFYQNHKYIFKHRPTVL